MQMVQSKTNQYLLTVVIPILRIDESLVETLSSISQFQDVLCLIVKPRSLNFYCPVNMKNIKYINESKRGIYEAFNDGLRATESKFIMFCGSGDILYLKNILKSLSDYPNAQIIEGQVMSSFSVRNITGLSKINPTNLDYLFSSHSVGLVFSTRFHKTVGYYDAKFTMCADYDLLIRAFPLMRNTQSISEVFGVWPIDGYSSTISGLSKACEHRRIRKNSMLPLANFYFTLNLFDFVVIQRIKNIIKSLIYK